MPTMDEDNYIFPMTPPSGSSAGDNDKHGANNQEKSDSDNESTISFNFDAPATIAPEGALFANPTSTPPSSRMPETFRNLSILLTKRRRAAAQNAMRGGATAWIDQDDSGTYDPKRKRATPDELPQKKAKRQRISSELNEEGNLKQKRFYKKVGYSLMVTLTLESEKGKEYLRSITPGSVDSESSNETESDSSTDSDHDSGYGSFLKPRRRKRQPQAPKRLGASTDRPDGLTIDDLTVGHPQRRGCKACFEAGDDECTLIDHEFEYPCEACKDGSVECELILEPQLKKVCERCKKKRRSCSYRVDGGKGVDACEQCVQEDVKCCAAPMKGSAYAKRFEKSSHTKRSKNEREVSGEAEEGMQRMWVMCNQCRDGGKRCSLKSKNSWGPCSCCRKNHEECKFVFPPPRQRQLLEAPDLSIRLKGKKSKAGKGAKPKAKGRWRSQSLEEDDLPDTPNRKTSHILLNEAIFNTTEGRKALKKGASPSLPLPLPTDLQTGKGHTFKKTCFSHPIQFNAEPSPDGAHPCNWCDYPLFGFFGHSDDSGPRTVEGFYHDNGDGFEEIAGGYSKLGFEQTRMCGSCTFDRLRIVGCEAHRYRKLVVGPMGPGVDQDERVWDEGEVWDAALEACERLVLEAKYCSVCPELAGYKCCAPSFSFTDEEEGEVEGCGLWLCDKCMELMGKGIAAGFSRGKESLDALVGEAARAKLLYPIGVRADAEFITSDGELMMRLGQGMGADGSDVENFGSPVREKYVQIPEPKKVDKGKGKDMSFFSPLPATSYTGSKGKGKEKDISYHTPKRETQRLQESPHVWIGDLKGGGWMNDVVVEGQEERKVVFGGEIAGKTLKKGKSTVWDKEKRGWGEVEVIELSSGDES